MIDTLTMPDGTNKTFIDAMEGRRYPFIATMFHPEYQLLEPVDFTGPKRWYMSEYRKEVAELAFRLSWKLAKKARENKNKPEVNFDDLYAKYGTQKAPAQSYPVSTDFFFHAYGYV